MQIDIKQKFLEKDELIAFSKIANDKHNPANRFEVFMPLAYIGMCAGELLVLKWSDLDMDECTISITKTYYNPNNNKEKYQILTHTTKSSIGTISVDPNVTKLLLDYKENVQYKTNGKMNCMSIIISYS